MTQKEIVTVLRELRGLERLLVAVQAQMMTPGASDELRYGVVALDDRIRWCRYCLSLEHPTAVGMADELLAGERLTPAEVRSDAQVSIASHLTDTPGRIH